MSLTVKNGFDNNSILCAEARNVYCAEYYRIINFCHMLNRFCEFFFHSFPQNDCIFIKKCQWDKMFQVAESNCRYLDW